GIPDPAAFEGWLQSGLGEDVDVGAFVAFLERRDTQAGEVLYREGESADAVDLLESGTLVVDMSRPGGAPLRVRRMMMHTVVGEMGFVRRSVRSATVSSEGPATVFTLTRARFERMRRERPDLASAFDDFLMRAL